MTKLLNNAMTMSNLKNAADMLRIASALKLDIKALVRAISVSSGASFVLSALATEITLDIAGHLQGLMRKDLGALRRRGAGTGDRPRRASRPGPGRRGEPGRGGRHRRRPRGRDGVVRAGTVARHRRVRRRVVPGGPLEGGWQPNQHCGLLPDPDEGVRKFAARGLANLISE